MTREAESPPDKPEELPRDVDDKRHEDKGRPKRVELTPEEAWVCDRATD